MIPYIISQAAGISVLVVAWKKTEWAKAVFALLFIWASGINMYPGLSLAKAISTRLPIKDFSV